MTKPLPEDLRISYTDLAIAWSVVSGTDQEGKGAIRRLAIHRAIPPSRVQHALDRVEAAFGGHHLLERKRKRMGRVTPAGQIFLAEGYELQKAWYALAMALDGIPSEEVEPIVPSQAT